MARIRTIKPEFWTDEKVVELSAFARLLFIGLWNFCDDDGRMVCSPKRIKMQVFPNDELNCAALVDELRINGVIQVYSVNGVEYLQVIQFSKHQKIDKRSASKLPSPPNPAESPRPPPNHPDGMEGNGMDQGMEGNSVPSGTGDESPDGKSEEPKTPEQLTKDELWAAGVSLLVQSGLPDKQCRSFVGGLVKDYGSAIVIESVRAAVVERPADAVAFLKAACMARKNEGGKTLIPWHATDAGVIAKGVERGKSPNPGESMLQFKARLIADIENNGKPPPKATPPPTNTKEARPAKGAKPEGMPALKSLIKPREAA